MERINTCRACTNEKNGVKTRIAMPHTCGKATAIKTTGDGKQLGVENTITEGCDDWDEDLALDEIDPFEDEENGW